MRYLLTLMLVSLIIPSFSQENASWQGKFEQLGQMITPTSPYRTASGTPGAEYWQQRADYTIKAEIDEVNNILTGEEVITYYNNSPDILDYVWIQLEQNVNRKENEDFGELIGTIGDSISSRGMQFLTRPIDFPAGYSIKHVKDADGQTLQALVNNTMMRVNLNEPLNPMQKVSLSITWSYHINFIIDNIFIIIY